MISKAEFLKTLEVKREANRLSIDGKIKKEYYASDNDLAWKLYMGFPGHFSTEERYKLLKFVVSHITGLVCFGLRADKEEPEIVDQIKLNLKETLDIHLSKKTISNFVKNIIKLNRWNDE